VALAGGTILEAALVAPQPLLDHGQGLVGAQGDELDVLERLALLVDEHDAGAARQARQHLAGFAEQVLDGAAPAASGDAALDLAALFDADVADLEQPVDEEAQARLRGQSSRARMRSIDEAEAFEVRHDVAHRCRRQRHRQRPA